MILYVTCWENIRLYDGIWKKMLGQLKSFSRAFEKAYISSWYNQMAYLFDGSKIIQKKIAISKKDYFETIQLWIEEYKIQRAYVRYPFSSKSFIDFLKYLSESNIISVLEIASYPYDDELSYGRIKMEDMAYRHKIPAYMRRIATYSEDDTIWDVPCFHLRNGIDLDMTPLKSSKKQMGVLTLIVVSSMAFWEGSERLIEGMRIYRNQNKGKVKVVFVGTGPEESYYKSLVKKYSLADDIKFLGFRSGTELDEIYNCADIGVGALGAYKKNIYTASALKIGEYCARGLPIVCGCRDNRFPEDTSFILQVSNNPTPVDIQSVIDFYHSVNTEKNYNSLIRKYAETHLSWDDIMKPIIDYLKNPCGK